MQTDTMLYVFVQALFWMVGVSSIHTVVRGRR